MRVVPVLATVLGAVALGIGAVAGVARAQAGDELTHVEGSPPAPDFELETLSGERIRLSDLRGQVVLINFWATWCPPCVEEMPSIQNAALRMQDEPFEVLLVNLTEEPDQIRPFVEQLGLSEDLTILLDRDLSVFKQFEGRGLPSSFVVDAQGHLIYKAEGPRRFDSEIILQQLRALTAAAPGAARTTTTAMATGRFAARRCVSYRDLPIRRVFCGFRPPFVNSSRIAHDPFGL